MQKITRTKKTHKKNGDIEKTMSEVKGKINSDKTKI